MLITCFHFPILCCRPIRNYTLHLEKLVWLIPTNDGKSKTHVAFLKSCTEESPLQLWCITGEEWFFYISQHKQERQKFWSSHNATGTAHNNIGWQQVTVYENRGNKECRHSRKKYLWVLALIQSLKRISYLWQISHKWRVINILSY